MNLRRATSGSKRALLLTLVLASAGCASVGMYYKGIDQEGPLADLSGVWANDDLSKLLVVQQTGASVRASFTSFGADNSGFDFTGEVKGRVLIGAADQRDRASIDGYSYWALELVITASPDGKTGTLAIVGMWGDPVTALDATTFHRLAGGPIPAATPKEPSLKGALACRLPFDRNGRLLSGGGAAPLRDAWMSLTYVRDAQGRLQPIRMVLPAEAPRVATQLPCPGDGLFGKAFDRSLLLSARSGLPPIQSTRIENKEIWWIVSPLWNSGSSDAAPSVMVAELYGQNPDSGALPEDAIEIARRAPGGGWSAAGGYLSGTSGLYRATARMENGTPAGVEVVDVAEPPLEDFLAAKEFDVPTARWRSGALLLVKNRTLPKLLRDGRTADLSRLVERLEKLVLDLNHEGEVAKDRAQRAVETQSGEAEHLREISLVYKERIEVLKPILAALKEEIANRAK